ncbi:DUF397 domain-containing protein [Embleya sp. NPDC050154]|uniref:DUF397 domain-containing protein n=1 Tax=unclassified Embleya TaxID=2699296 RepID=UPI0037A3B570
MLGSQWRKSSYSGGGESSCVEVASFGRFAGVRDSKVANGPAHLFTSAAWVSLLRVIQE